MSREVSLNVTITSARQQKRASRVSELMQACAAIASNERRGVLNTKFPANAQTAGDH